MIVFRTCGERRWLLLNSADGVMCDELETSKALASDLSGSERDISDGVSAENMRSKLQRDLFLALGKDFVSSDETKRRCIVPCVDSACIPTATYAVYWLIN